MCIRDRIAPSIEREIRNELTEKAEDGAIRVFGKNLEQLLMQPPIAGQVVLGWDPAFRTGCKLAVVDATGKVLDTAVIYPNAPQNKVAEALSIIHISGTRPALVSFGEKNQKKGAMISAVDLLKGIAVGSGMTNIQVEGANGQLHTNYEGKAQAAADALLKDGFDFVYVHVEAPDEMGHQGSWERKVQSIEYLDQRLIRNLTAALDASGEAYRMMVLPDHPTPVKMCIRDSL